VRKLKKIVCGLFIGYVLIYAILSLAGSYQEQPFWVGSNVRNFCWAPLGFYNPNRVSESANSWNNGWQKWNKTMVYTFYPLFKLDRIYIHKNVDDPKISGE
jgi:hypothetical protein